MYKIRFAIHWGISYTAMLNQILYTIILISPCEMVSIIESMLLTHFFFAFLFASVYNKEAYNVQHQEKGSLLECFTRRTVPCLK